MLLGSLFAIFAILLFAGMPVAFAMAIAGVAAVLQLENVSHLLFPQRMYLALNSFPLLAVPFFILAGELMNRGGITLRIVAFANALVGHLRGGLAHVLVVAEMILSGVSGSASADAVAIGSVMIPAMQKAGYPTPYAAGLTAAASTIGPIIPPSIVMVIYGAMTGVSIGAMFLGGFIPGIMVGIGLMIINYVYARRYGWGSAHRASLAEVRRTFFEAIWAILAPVIIIGGILTGVFTPTEAGVVACIYGLLVGMLVYREIHWRDLRPMLVNSSLYTAVPMIIVGGAQLFGWVLARENFSATVTRWIVGISTDPNVTYAVIIAVLFVVGCFVEALAAILIFVPVLLPVGAAMNYNPVHFALVIIIVMLVGTLTPPVGLQLYICSAIAKVPLSKMVVWPFVLVLMITLLIITYIPWTVTVVPDMFFKK